MDFDMPTTRGARRLDSPQREASSAGRSWDAYLPPHPNRARRAFKWAAVLVVALVLPFLFTGTFAISVLTQICIAITFALAYNMLLGGTGLLSFGHALYFGIGAYATAHVLNAFGEAVPVVLVPLVGGVAALVLGACVALFTLTSFCCGIAPSAILVAGTMQNMVAKPRNACGQNSCSRPHSESRKLIR